MDCSIHSNRSFEVEANLTQTEKPAVKLSGLGIPRTCRTRYISPYKRSPLLFSRPRGRQTLRDP